MIKVRAIRDGFMGEGEVEEKYQSKFCTKGKTYEVITQDTDTFKIIDDDGDEHTFEFDDNQWFEFMEEEKS